jgi:DNA-binding GntR family transcriptional regulator
MSKDSAAQLALVRDTLPATRAKQHLVNEVYDRLKENLFEFRMLPGQRYSEQQLANLFGVSRTPLRLALHLLAHEGYLLRLEGHSSWQVQPMDLAHYDELYDFRTCIELIALRRLCEMKSAPDIGALEVFWEDRKNCDPTNGKAVAEADEVFHQTMVDLAGNNEMARTFAQLTERIRIIRRLDFTDAERIAAAFDEHTAILRTLRDRNGERAETLIKEHINMSRCAIRQITLHRLSAAALQMNQS